MLEVALWPFSHLHPYGYDAKFDETLLSPLPADELDRTTPGRPARERPSQLRYRDERRRDLDVERLTPVAADLLDHLERAERKVLAPMAPQARSPRDGAGPTHDVAEVHE